jgi:hypothetical protein
MGKGMRYRRAIYRGIKVRLDLTWTAINPKPWGNLDGNEILWKV